MYDPWGRLHIFQFCPETSYQLFCSWFKILHICITRTNIEPGICFVPNLIWGYWPLFSVMGASEDNNKKLHHHVCEVRVVWAFGFVVFNVFSFFLLSLFFFFPGPNKVCMPAADNREHNMDWRARSQCRLPPPTSQGTHLYWVTVACLSVVGCLLDW